MALTYDAKAASSYTGDASNPVVVSMTLAATATVLIVGIVTPTTATRGGGAPTWNGTALTQVGSNVVGSGECNTELWYKLAPGTGGPYNISVPNTGTLNLYVGAVSFKGSVGVVFDQSATNNTSSAAPYINLAGLPVGSVAVNVLGHGYKDTAIDCTSPHDGGAVTASYLHYNDFGAATGQMNYHVVISSTRTRKFNGTTQSSLAMYSGATIKMAAAFKYDVDTVITSAKWYLVLTGSPTGTASFKIYNSTGTYGTTAVPTGSALETTSEQDITSGTYLDQSFTSPFTCSAGVVYFISVEYTSTFSNSSNYLYPYIVSGANNNGNCAYYVSSWSADSGKNLSFLEIFTNPDPTLSLTQSWVMGSLDDVAMIMASFEESAPAAILTGVTYMES